MIFSCWPTMRRMATRKRPRRWPLLAVAPHSTFPIFFLLFFNAAFTSTSGHFTSISSAADSFNSLISADPTAAAVAGGEQLFTLKSFLLNAQARQQRKEAAEEADGREEGHQANADANAEFGGRPEMLAGACPRELLHVHSFRHFPLVCRTQPSLAIVAYEGILDAMDECRRQMRFQRWDCTQPATVLHEPTITKHAYRESAYLWAMSAAGVAWGIATACAQGWLDECRCANGISQQQQQQAGGDHRQAASDWDWGGCSYGIQYGVVSSRKLLTRTSSAARLHHHSHGDGIVGMASAAASRHLLHKFEKHNLKVGRLAVKRTLSSSCRCHGVSGSCQQKTCWKRPAELASIAQHLAERYRRAKMISSMPAGQLNARNSDLVYLEPGIDLCSQFRYDVHQKRSLPRVCSWRNATHVEGDCSDLCCGLGYSVRHEVIPYKCECKFVWCCRLECRECLEHRWISTCNT